MPKLKKGGKAKKPDKRIAGDQIVPSLNRVRPQLSKNLPDYETSIKLFCALGKEEFIKKVYSHLNEKELRFVFHYTRHWNGARAVRESGYLDGYDETTSAANTYSHKESAQLRTRADINEAVNHFMATTRKKTDASLDAWRKEVESIAFGNVKDVVSWDEEGVQVVPSEQLTHEQTAGLGDLEANTTTTAYGLFVSKDIKFKRESKLAALKLLGAHHGWIGNIAEDGKDRQILGQGARARIARELADNLEAFERRFEEGIKREYEESGGK